MFCNKNIKAMKTFLKPIILALTIISALFIVSCVKEYHDYSKLSTEIQNDWTFNLPVAYAKFSAYDLMKKYDKEGKVHAYDVTNLLYIVFQNQIASKTAKDFIKLELNNSDLEYYLSGPVQTAFGGGATSYSLTKNVNHSLRFDKPRIIDSINLKSGSIALNVRSGFEHAGTIVLNFPTIKKNGSPLSYTINLDNTGNFKKDISIPLDGYSIGLRHISNLDSNELPYTVKLTLVKNGLAPVNANDSVVFNGHFVGLEFSSMFGYFGQDNVISEDTIKLGINMIEGTPNFHFQDPRIAVTVNNSLGLPIRMTVENFYAQTVSGTGYNLTFSPATANKFDAIYPNLSQFGKSVIFDTTIRDVMFPAEAGSPKGTLDNLSIAVNANPEFMKYKMLATTNPANNKSDHSQFVTDTGKISVNVGLELPLYGYTKDYILFDTQNLDMQGIYGSNSQLKRLKIYLYVNNGMPANIKLQAYFTDTTCAIIYDSLFATASDMEIISAATVDPATGSVKAAVDKTSEIQITQAKLDDMMQVKKLVIKLIFLTTGASTQQNVKIFSTNWVDTQIRLSADVEVKTRF